MLILASCSSDDDNTPFVIPNPGPENTLKATIDGTQYIFNSFVVETVTSIFMSLQKFWETTRKLSSSI